MKSYTCDKESFIGMYGSQERLAALLRTNCRESATGSAIPCAALQVEMELAPGQSKSASYSPLAPRSSARRTRRNCWQVSQLPRGFQATLLGSKSDVGRFARDREGRNARPGLNIMTNYWSKYQAISAGRFRGKSGITRYRPVTASGTSYRTRRSSLFPTRASRRKQILLHAL